jgi:NAD+ diphosphatase
MVPDHKERMLHCSACQNMVYPRISPAVIVGVIHEDKLLMSKYAGRSYTNYALIAGFTEIGESAEQTVAREVMEEVGLKVKNIRYYKSQPWAFSDSLLMGFFCDLDGSDEIRLDTGELAEAGWYSREEITLEDDNLSLTREMMMLFKNGAVL